MGSHYIKKHGEEFISKAKQKDFMFAEKKPKLQRPAAVYSNPQYSIIYSNEWEYYKFITRERN